MNNIKQNGRVATVKRTGEKFLVTQRDLDLHMVHCQGALLAFRGLGAKFDAPRSFREDEVTVADVYITHQLLSSLFDQTRKSTKVQPQILIGDLEVHLRKDATEGRFVKAPKSSVPHVILKCPCHDVSMRQRRGPKGGTFWACPTRSETGCNITCSADGTDWFGVTDAAAE